MLRTSIINFVSKIGLAVPFLYSFFISVLNPQKAISRWPNFLSHHINETVLILITSLVSASIVFWIFTNKLKFAAVSTALVSLSLVLLINIDDLNLVFESIPALCLALGLSLRYYPRVRVITGTKVTIPSAHAPTQANTSTHLAGVANDHDEHLFVPEHK